LSRSVQYNSYIVYFDNGRFYLCRISIFSSRHGRALVKCIQSQDNTLVQALVLVYSALSIVGLILGDIAMTIMDPRISFGKKGGSR
jgi:ABC-type microcin C transport system permease subunit YejB